MYFGNYNYFKMNQYANHAFILDHLWTINILNEKLRLTYFCIFAYLHKKNTKNMKV